MLLLSPSCSSFSSIPLLAVPRFLHPFLSYHCPSSSFPLFFFLLLHLLTFLVPFLPFSLPFFHLPSIRASCTFFFFLLFLFPLFPFYSLSHCIFFLFQFLLFPLILPPFSISAREHSFFTTTEESLQRSQDFFVIRNLATSPIRGGGAATADQEQEKEEEQKGFS